MNGRPTIAGATKSAPKRNGTDHVTAATDAGLRYVSDQTTGCKSMPHEPIA